MKYYKMIQDTQIIGVCSSFDFKKYNIYSHLLLFSDENEGQFINYKDKLYRDYWMTDIPAGTNLNFEIIRISEISQEEYNNLKSLFETYDTIDNMEPQNEVPIITVIVPENQEENTLEKVKELKLKILSYTCRQSIYNGFDIEWEDETISHFAMTEQDQLNLMELNNMINSGLPQLPYHADGEEAKFYTPEEAQMIIAAATKHKLYHTSYFNCLKAYIQSLETIATINEIEYGDEIPVEFQSEVYKMVM